MSKISLLIMAAGIGSRFGGGIKQLEPVGLKDEIIMDYSIFDAIEAGFNKIIIVIRKDIEADFKERIGNRIETICAERNVEVAYAFQDMADIPAGFEIPKDRTKPWGTGQAVLAAKDVINEPFAVINADDYYGKKAFVQLYNWLNKPHQDTELAMAGFILKNTLSENGAVTRGVCELAADGKFLSSVHETSGIEIVGDGVRAGDASLDPEAYVSMNFWGFPASDNQKPAFLQTLIDEFVSFFEKDVPQNPEKAEYLLPILIGRLLEEKQLTVEVLETTDKWFGVTYKEDKPSVMANFKKLIDDGVYGKDLWN